MNPAIIIVAYNRPKNLKRLLHYIRLARYNHPSIPLIISIDFQNSVDHESVVKIAQEFTWDFGEKKLIIHSRNLGLKNHILSCGDLSKRYGSVIILEDDLIVSPHFYDFAHRCSNFYYDNVNVAGISLYAYEYEEINNYKFYPINEGYDTFFMQWASSWGQLFTDQQWLRFKEWYNSKYDLSNIKIHNTVKRWTNSWKKYYSAYLVDTNKYFVFPYSSYTSIIDQKGTHLKKESRSNQVKLNFHTSYHEDINFSFPEIDKVKFKYDSFFQITSRELYIKSLNKNLIVDFDLYGTKHPSCYASEYLITLINSKNILSKFSNSLIPLEYNILKNEQGLHYNLTHKSDICNSTTILYRGRKLYHSRKIYSVKEMIYIVLYRIYNSLLN